MSTPAAAPFEFTSVTVTFPELKPGERWVGLVTTERGFHHVILLPGDNDEASQKRQLAWAESIGGDLPDLLELALLWRMLPAEFQRDWYWSCERLAGDESSAWYQNFNYGTQYYDDEYCELRARAVRRVPI